MQLSRFAQRSALRVIFNSIMAYFSLVQRFTWTGSRLPAGLAMMRSSTRDVDDVIL
jgi:hypothetical protein